MISQKGRKEETERKDDKWKENMVQRKENIVQRKENMVRRKENMVRKEKTGWGKESDIR
ncbi:hypothetical protein M422DRAFT_31929 [Sphaerobolus stellatus SS14]|uniref:Uncharacterized protein n=1 Tax=Sphaerobolus stellatus (strain SS14) TaxID=990650 RepID=A0A0C9U8J5_SPHS4|nr:hypothetical protein M422DRAFT_38800 [Sphaerobolus stellatus SS14]KIJ41043.1 hypothetical protein M422DRAFT_31929 [Sphaerobolus stellatus SS14]